MTLRLIDGQIETDAQLNEYPGAVVHPIRVIMEYGTNSGELIVGVWKSWAARDAGFPPIRTEKYVATMAEYAQRFALQTTGTDDGPIFIRINTIIDDWLLSMTEEQAADDGTVTTVNLWSDKYELMPESEKD